MECFNVDLLRINCLKWIEDFEVFDFQCKYCISVFLGDLEMFFGHFVFKSFKSTSELQLRSPSPLSATWKNYLKFSQIFPIYFLFPFKNAFIKN